MFRAFFTGRATTSWPRARFGENSYVWMHQARGSALWHEAAFVHVHRCACELDRRLASLPRASNVSFRLSSFMSPGWNVTAPMERCQKGQARLGRSEPLNERRWLNSSSSSAIWRVYSRDTCYSREGNRLRYSSFDSNETLIDPQIKGKWKTIEWLRQLWLNVHFSNVVSSIISILKG